MKKYIILAVVALIASATAYGQAPVEKKKKVNAKAKFDKVDLNKDGRISRAEAEKTGKKKFIARFGIIDTNKDGYLTKQELKAYKKAKPNKGKNKQAK